MHLQALELLLLVGHGVVEANHMAFGTFGGTGRRQVVKPAFRVHDHVSVLIFTAEAIYFRSDVVFAEDLVRRVHRGEHREKPLLVGSLAQDKFCSSLD